MSATFSESSSSIVRHAPWLASALPLARALALVDGTGGFAEEGSFIAAAREFSVPYAPGAPVSSLLSSLLALLPIGPLSYRVALLSALCAAVSMWLLTRALIVTLRRVSVHHEGTAAWLALVAAWALSATPLWTAQATRAQPFALQFALSMVIVDALLRFEAQEPHGATRTLYFAAFVQGLCFANHHVFGLLLLPVAAPTLGRVFAHRGFMGLMGHVAAPLLGFSVYIYVPLRLGSGPYGYGEQTGLQRVLSMLSAEPYWGPAYQTPLSAWPALQRGLSLAPWAVWTLLALVSLGMWSSLRSSARRRFGLLWLIALVVPWSSVALVLRPALERDLWGALVPCAASLLVFACVGLGTLLDALGQLSPRLSTWGVAALLPLCLWSFGTRGQARALHADAQLAEAMDDLMLRQLPSYALLFSGDASSAFRLRGREAEEALRPDVTLVPLAFRALPHTIDSWVAETPELSDSLRDLLLTGQLAPASLQSLAAQRPVYVELDESVPYALYGSLLDEGLYARVYEGGVASGDLRAERAAQAVRLLALERARSHRQEASFALRERLARAHFFQALVRVRHADVQGARDYLALDLPEGTLRPSAERLREDLRQGHKLEADSYLPAPVETLGQ